MRIKFASIIIALVATAGLCGCEKMCGKPADGPPGKTPEVKSYEGMTEVQIWDEAEETGSLEAYEAYVSSYPAGANVQRAKEVLRELWRTRAADLSAEKMEELTAVIETDKGSIRFKFYPIDAPETCRNFIVLAQSHFYDGLIFHRVVPGFVIQGGSPTNDGMGGPGYTIKAEFNSRKHLQGTVAMARGSDPDSAGSQFYICLAPQPFLDDKYTVFGQIVQGMQAAELIGQVETDANDKPLEDQVIKKAYVEGL